MCAPPAPLLQHPGDRCGHAVAGCEQLHRVEVALHRLAGQKSATLGEGKSPVDADGLARQLADDAVEVAGIDGEVGARHAELPERSHQTAVGGERELPVGLGVVQPGPRVEELDRLGAGLDLHGEVAQADPLPGYRMYEESFGVRILAHK